VTGLLGRLLGGGPTLSAGVLTADLLHLGRELERLEEAGVDIVHVDVMDGVFCPAITVGPPLVQAIPGHFVRDVHLMIDEPLEKLDAFVEAGAGILTFHVEATRHPHRALQALAGTDVVRGVALNPGTPLAVVEPLLDDLELILILAVNPGWSGQRFLETTGQRLAAARALTRDREIAVGVDGGVTRANGARVASLGPDLVVAGSAVFDGGDAAENARLLLDALRFADTEPGRAGAGAAANSDSRQKERQ
jgi:ribulose-phosphate 3-epimerase